MASSWYNDGVEVLRLRRRGGQLVMAAAEAAGAKVTAWTCPERRIPAVSLGHEGLARPSSRLTAFYAGSFPRRGVGAGRGQGGVDCRPLPV